MRRPRVRFTVRRLMAAVAVAALASMAVARVSSAFPDTEMRLTALEACLISAAYGVGSIRWPPIFLMPLLLIQAITSVSQTGLYLVSGGCFVAWIVGAPVGWFLRVHRRRAQSSGSRHPSKYWSPIVEADGEPLRCHGNASDSRSDG